MKRLLRIFKDKSLSQIAVNAGYVFVGNSAASVLGLLSLGIMAKTIGPTGLGLVLLADAFVKLVDQVVRVETWPAIIRYGSKAIEEGRSDDFRRLVKFTQIIDVSFGILAGVFASTILYFAFPFIGFSDQQFSLTATYSLTLFVVCSSSSTGLLRLFGKFNLLALQTVILAVVRLFAFSCAWYLGGGVWSFIFIMCGLTVVENLLPVCNAWIELRRHGHGGYWRLPIKGVMSENTGILSFIAGTNLNALARQSTQRLDAIMVAGTLGTAAAGIYQLSRRVGLAAGRLGQPLQQAVFPDIARLWARGEHARFRRVVFSSLGLLCSLAFVVSILGYVFAPKVVDLVFGDEFAGLASPIIIHIVAASIFIGTNVVGPALLSMGYQRYLLALSILAACIFFALLVPLAKMYGPTGAAFCTLVYNVILLSGGWSLLLYAQANHKKNLSGP